jgi:glycosyltransferase involved in cell wall biosynthesis
MFHLNFLVLLLRPFLSFPICIFIRQNGTTSAAVASLPRYTRLLYRMLYPGADMVICQSAAMAKDLSENFAVPKTRLDVLPNPVDFDAMASANPSLLDAWPDSGPHLLAVGRLSQEKGFDLLLRSVCVVRQRFPSADLLIAGSGPEGPSLRSLCQALALDAAVRFLGHVDFPASCFSTATLYVLSSRHEGLPNALLEAAAAGLPIVTTPASEGLVELVHRQPGIWLATAPTAEAIADALIAALNALEPGQRFHHTFVEPFALGPAIAAWESLIDRFISDVPTAGVRIPSGSTAGSV